MAPRIQGTYNPGEHIAAIETRVSNLETGIANIQQSITSLASKFETSSKTNWPAIFAGFTVVLGVLGLIGKLAYDPIAENMLRISHEIELQGHDTITREEANVVTKMRDNQLVEIYRRLDTLERKLAVTP